MVHPKSNPKAVWEFYGDVLVLHHPTTISPKYQAMGRYIFPICSAIMRIQKNMCHHHLVHCGSIRQTASILKMNQNHLRTGDKASVHFRFLKNPEYLRAGQRFVFREGRTKAVGTITDVIILTTCPL